MKYARCNCCGELGHTIDNCPRDPNIKTKVADYDTDIQRIQKIQDFRKLFADTAVTTTHLLKKCVKVPKVELATAENPDGLTRNEADEILEKQ